MSKDIPDYMREFDTSDDWGFTPVTSKPEPKETKVDVDMSAVEQNGLEIAKVKSDVSDIKSMMNEIMQIVAEKEDISKEITDEDIKARFKETLNDPTRKKVKTDRYLRESIVVTAHARNLGMQ